MITRICDGISWVALQILIKEYHLDLNRDSRVFLTLRNCNSYATRRYPPDSVTSKRAFDGSGSIFCRNL